VKEAKPAIAVRGLTVEEGPDPEDNTDTYSVHQEPAEMAGVKEKIVDINPGGQGQIRNDQAIDEGALREEIVPVITIPVYDTI